MGLLCWCTLSPQGPSNLAAIRFSAPVRVASIQVFPKGARPFAEYEDFVDDDHDEAQDGLGVCKACAEMVRRRSFKERKDVRDRLPELLDIDVPGWRK